jgi:hypothetical protein
MLKDEMAFLEDSLTKEEIETLKIIRANITDVGRITCRPGMKTDLASVPRIAWILVAPWDIARAAIIHDLLYLKIRQHRRKLQETLGGENYAIITKAKKAADNVFLMAMRDANPNVPSWKINAAYYAVVSFGRWSIIPREGD